ncbi:MAG: hypothetical protein SVT52_05570 [Planctomycetota bacterium]|nr:hypothetical protein [Planctomycetota bacterium]
MAKDSSYKNISEVSGACCRCGVRFEPGQELVATLREADDPDEVFLREDYCPACWQANEQSQDPNLYGVWRSLAPRPDEKKKLFVDDDLLINFFERLSNEEQPIKVSFRFVLALVLMRKKLLVYDGMVRMDDGTEVWKMHFKGDGKTCEVTNPQMDEQKIAAVSGQLSEILNQDIEDESE